MSACNEAMQHVECQEPRTVHEHLEVRGLDPIRRQQPAAKTLVRIMYR